MTYKNKVIIVLCEKIVFPGRSLCRCDDGTALFTEGLLPNEKAEVYVTKDKKTFREGYVKSIISKSEHRIEPVCPLFNKCGGCSFQNVEYANQLYYKQQYLNELLSFTEVNISPILPNPKIYHYRNKMEFSFFDNGGDIELGLHYKGSFDRYVPVSFCFIADEDFSKAVEIIKEFANKSGLPPYNNKTHNGFFRHLVLRKAQNNNQFLINIAANAIDEGSDFFNPLIKDLQSLVQSAYWTCNTKKSDAVISDSTKLLFGSPYIVEKLTVGSTDYFFNISPFSFFQTNSSGAEVLYNEALKLLNPRQDDILLDLYCGTGTIGISMSRKVKKVIAVEQIRQSVEDAVLNAKINKADNIEFFDLTVQDWLKTPSQKFDLIVVDPPRSGLTKDVINFLIKSDAEKIIYASCNPSTLARDLHLIIESGKYEIKKIVPVDMFSHTYHIETMVLLEIK
ncbi:MAG: 23S rRNA (uracil(1939)-C(5))-methyltransferase RlmD [Elusimicrobiota bacterium]|nr:23S rRNA (uracil(1939)-C(5))-methyltransferase RlmD [Elusimicrobiota bacterium]